MDVSYRWLRAVAPGLQDDPDTVADRLAMYGAPADAIVRAGAGLEALVVGRVEAVRSHPNADRLSLCDVHAGGAGPVQVVCGAPNVEAGRSYPFAPVDATLPDGTRIERAEIRGEESLGMLCSERELGLGRDQSGILELPEGLEPGTPLVEAMGLDDVRFELDVTPNRPDLLCHVGVARELAPGGDAGIEIPALPGAEDGPALRWRRVERDGETEGVAIRIEDADAGLRYTGTVIRGVRVGPSPAWLAERLRAVGQRPINNIVDATNYVMLELGQPMHAFDLARLAGPEIRVRPAAAAETIETLDGVRRTLERDMLVIADAEAPVAIAGVMGGRESEVGDGTRDVLLEAALFAPGSIRSTRSALGMSTDASFRFERGVDPEGVEAAVRRAVALIRAVAGGEATETLDVYPDPEPPLVVALRPSRVATVLGAELELDTVTGYLQELGFERESAEDDGLSFRVPGYRRHDVQREIDLIEEIARRHGYQSFPDELETLRPSAVPEDPMFPLEDRLRDMFVGRGFLEARSVPFGGEEEGDVALLHPLSQEESRLRRNLVAGLTHRVEHNFARGVRDIRLFEIGTVFAPSRGGEDARPHEETHLAAIMTGARQPPHWSTADEAFDLWDLKGLAAAAGVALGATLEVAEEGADPVSSLAEKRYDLPRFRLLRDGEVVGAAGRIRGDRVDAPAWAAPVWAVECRLDATAAKPRSVRVRPLPAHPPVDRDLALLVPGSRSAADVGAALADAGGALLEGVSVFDVYEGADIDGDRRSLGFRLRFRAPDRTLTDAEVDEAVDRVLTRLKEELGVERRG